MDILKDMDIILLGTSYMYFAVYQERLKSVYNMLSKETIDKISNEGVLHFTSRETAEKIIESGYLNPSNGLSNNHFAKSRYGDKFANFVYAYSGKPTFSNFLQNFTGKSSKDGTLYAVRYYPDKYDLENFTERALDGALMYEGKMHLSNAKIVRFKVNKNNELEEIPLYEEVKEKLTGTKKFLYGSKFIKNTVSCMYTIGNLPKQLIQTYINPSNRLKLQMCIARRKYDNALLAQINENYNEMTVEQNEKNYSILPLGAKIDGGKILSGFRVNTENEDFEKSVFIDLTDRSQIKDEDLCKFIMQYSNMDSERSEYIGKPVFREGNLRCEIDDKYKKYFNRQQLMKEKNGEIPKQKSKILITNQLKKLAENYARSTVEGRKKVFKFIKGIMQKERNTGKVKGNGDQRDGRN